MVRRRRRGGRAEADQHILARSFSVSGGAISDIFQNIFDAITIEGVSAAIDSTQDWTVEVSVEIFSLARLSCCGPAGVLNSWQERNR